ncbi:MULTISPECIES: DUF2513 domain-containing protein [Pseudomonas syringae group]|uniref:DUF2513 domain-containing protein n=1 Tax=Pseudomonas syringae group TaxID=136849 RepID=UPI0005CA54B5|nr:MULTISPECIES: DUF2513 domain-containing protein [Pseudomonas syringae group]MEE4124028.1 DUF2513 domain-containing protein [Pseudomonas viridiflava]
MRRDMDLIRAIVLKLEAWHKQPSAIFIVQDIENDFPIEGFTSEEIIYHYQLIAEKGWVDTAGSTKNYRTITFRGLTSDGHDFADSVRDDKVWSMTREGALKAGAFSIDLLSQLAKGFAKKQIENYTGITL